MKEAIECFNSKKFIEAKKILLKELSTNSTDILLICNYIIKVDEALSLRTSQVIIESYLDELHQNQDYLKYTEVYTKHRSSKEEYCIEIKIKYFESLYLSGALDKALKESKEMITYMVENKFYNVLDQYLVKVKKYYKGYLFYEYAALISELELGNYEKAICTVDIIIEKITSKWSLLVEKKKSQREYLTHLFTIINSFQIKDYLFKKSLLLKKAKLSKKYSFLKLTKDEVTEFMIIYQDEKEHYYLITEIINDEFLGYDILDYLRKNKIKDVKAYKKKRIKIIEKYKKEASERDAIHSLKGSKNDILENDYDNEIKEYQRVLNEYNQNSSKGSYKFSLGEINKMSTTQRKEVVQVLMSMRHYTEAKKVIETLKPEDKLRSLYQLYTLSEKNMDNIAFLSSELASSKSKKRSIEILSYLSEVFQKIGEDVKAENTQSLLNSLSLDLNNLESKLNLNPNRDIDMDLKND